MPSPALYGVLITVFVRHKLTCFTVYVTYCCLYEVVLYSIPKSTGVAVTSVVKLYLAWAYMGPVFILGLS